MFAFSFFLDEWGSCGRGEVLYETKVSHVQRGYQFSSVHIYVLEDGYSLYYFSKGKKAWKRGDEIAVTDPFVEPFDETEIFVDVKNLTNKKSGVLLKARMGSPEAYCHFEHTC